MATKQLHILYIGNKLAEHGRTPTSIDTLGTLLEQEGHILYYTSNKLKQSARLQHMLLSIWKYRKEVDLVLIDTYSTTAFYYAWLSAKLCRWLGIKYVPILHGGNLPARFQRSPGKCRTVFGNSTINIAVSPYLLHYLEQAGYKGTVIENSIALEDYSFRHRRQVRRQLLWVRSFHETYNPQMAVHLVHALKKQYPDIHLTMVGPEVDGSMEKCKALSAELGVMQQITFTGKLSKQEWTKLAQEKDIFINTTNYDNLPVSVLEAMALGLPVVSTNVGGIPYIITDKKTGLLVNADDVAAMKTAITQLLSDDSMAANIGKNAREYAAQYDWNIIKNKWHNLLQSIGKS